MDKERLDEITRVVGVIDSVTKALADPLPKVVDCGPEIRPNHAPQSWIYDRIIFLSPAGLEAVMKLMTEDMQTQLQEAQSKFDRL